MEMELEKIRRDTPCKAIDLNHASTSIPSLPFTWAVQSYYNMALEYRATSVQEEKLTGERVEAAQAGIVKLLNAKKEEIVFMSNGSMGLDVITRGIAWSKGVAE